MSIINFIKTDCQNCYACVRVCAVHAVRVRDGQAEIDEEKCIACGKCLDLCPKNAKTVQSELNLVRKYIDDNKTIVLSLAPTYLAVFNNPEQFCAQLKASGFTYVEETIVGAELVTAAYQKFSKEKTSTWISSCCPSVNLLVQKYYPDLIPYLIPIVSPMVSHSRLIKQKYGNDVKVVFAGPCLSKKLEARDENTIDAVLTFDELKKITKDVTIDDLSFDDVNHQFKAYPIEGGISSHIEGQKIEVTGLEECVEALEAIRKGQLTNTFIEMSACRYSCINGSAMPKDGTSVYERILKIKNSAQNRSSQKIEVDKSIDISCSFKDLTPHLEIPNEETLSDILCSMGKYSKDDELNCTYCGYSSCKDKAIAIYNGMAEADMCLPYMKQRAETLTNVMFDVTPSVVMMINNDFEIVEFNPAAERFFNIKKKDAMGLPISIYLNESMFKYVSEYKIDLIGNKVSIDYNKTTVMQSIVWVESHEVMLCIIHDLTNQLKKQEWMKNLQINAVDMAQEVINKQMRVAQEIASLLGETTAETKVTLTRLKALINKNGEDDDEVLC